jgi:hypothetical protein
MAKVIALGDHLPEFKNVSNPTLGHWNWPPFLERGRP